MSPARSSARFRIRLEDGSEVPVASVEALARRLERHDILPETPLFDGSTGEWGTAGTSPVVRFILEEMEREGYMLAEAWSDLPPLSAGEPDAPGASPEVAPEPPAEADSEAGVDPAAEPEAEHSVDPVEAEPDEEALQPAEEAPQPTDEVTPDPDAGGESFLDFGLTLDPAADEAEPPAGEPVDPELGPDLDLAPDTSAAPDDEPAETSSFETIPDLEDFSLPDDEPDSVEETEAPKPPGGHSPVEDAPGERADETGAEVPPDLAPMDASEEIRFEPQMPDLEPEPALPGPGGAPPGESPRYPAEDRPPPPRRRAPKDPWGNELRDSAPTSDEPIRIQDFESREGSKRRLPLLLLALMAAVGLSLDRWGAEWIPGTLGSRSVAGPEVVAVQIPSAPPPPPELVAVAEAALDDVTGRFHQAVDAVRAAAGIGDGPPAGWLGGYYLAHAGEFPEVITFWQTYADLVEDLYEQDTDLFLAAAEGAGARHAPDHAEELETYLRVRYLHVEPERRARYESLARAAATAVALHTFLAEHEDDLEYTPAVGVVVPQDPVMEISAEDPAFRQELNRRLDLFFDALYRARGGGAPHPEGLQAELFPDFPLF